MSDTKFTPHLKAFYEEKVAPELQSKRGYKNRLQIPRLQKIVLNMGVSALLDKSALDEAASAMAQVAGQQPMRTLARKSISNFKLREGMPVGCKATLRGERMWDFLFRLVAVALPAIRDFRGVPRRFDGKGNYSLGIADITIFPEVPSDQIKRQTGLEITIVTTSADDEEAAELLALLGMPFRKRESAAESAA